MPVSNCPLIPATDRKNEPLRLYRGRMGEEMEKQEKGEDMRGKTIKSFLSLQFGVLLAEVVVEGDARGVLSIALIVETVKSFLQPLPALTVTAFLFQLVLRALPAQALVFLEQLQSLRFERGEVLLQGGVRSLEVVILHHHHGEIDHAHLHCLRIHPIGQTLTVSCCPHGTLILIHFSTKLLIIELWRPTYTLSLIPPLPHSTSPQSSHPPTFHSASSSSLSQLQISFWLSSALKVFK